MGQMVRDLRRAEAHLHLSGTPVRRTAEQLLPPGRTRQGGRRSMTIERGSDKHGARADDALAGEVEGAMRSGHSTHAQEWKDPEPSGEDQPDVDLNPNGTLTGGTPAGVDSGDVEGRSELAT